MIYELIFAGVSFFQPQILQDSIGTETINGKVFVIHMVAEKETLYGLSKRYGTTVEVILQYNPTADAGLEIGQILKIPYLPKQAARSVNGVTHTVVAKETMFSISQAYNVTVEEIKQWNNLSGNSLSIGQELIIKSGKTSNNPEAAAVAASGLHVVAAKETMFSISKQYGVTVQQLKDWNKLEGNEISIGQELIVRSPQVEITKPNPPAVITEPKHDTPSVQPKTEVKEQTIRISESVKNSDEITQSGLAELIEGTEGNRKYLALHRTAPVGTILKVKNEMNNREVFVRVMGKLPDTPLTDKLVIKISKSAYDRLGAIDSRFRVELTYYK
ncbi:MAG: LysM peptidoglycan-binding domain-containing protein [Cyclobacteriaceae bacterium]|nr:LysM peptidoglycan-binding domain-containing protein [Cyclobacteriaceae bacterium]MDH5251164.1 LysM peptidoglycan-binding domain-containing protein [Cyclobacteriaceae bacterium]